MKAELIDMQKHKSSVIQQYNPVLVKNLYVYN